MTVNKAIKQYYLQVILPFFLTITSGILLGTGLIFRYPVLGSILLFGAIPVSGFLSVILYTRWFVSAFLEVDDPGMLYKRMTSTNMVSPKGSFWNKLHIKWGIEPGAYEAAWKRIEEPINEVPKGFRTIIESSLEIKGSTALFYVNLVLSIIITIGMILFGFIIAQDPITPQIGLVFLILGLGLVYELYLTRQAFYNMNRVVLQLSPEGLAYKGIKYSWSNIQLTELKRTSSQKFILYLGVSSNENGKPDMLKVPASGLEMTPDRLLELVAMYRKGAMLKQMV